MKKLARKIISIGVIVVLVLVAWRLIWPESFKKTLLPEKYFSELLDEELEEEYSNAKLFHETMDIYRIAKNYEEEIAYCDSIIEYYDSIATDLRDARRSELSELQMLSDVPSYISTIAILRNKVPEKYWFTRDGLLDQASTFIEFLELADKHQQERIEGIETLRKKVSIMSNKELKNNIENYSENQDSLVYVEDQDYSADLEQKFEDFETEFKSVIKKELEEQFIEDVKDRFFKEKADRRENKKDRKNKRAKSQML